MAAIRPWEHFSTVPPARHDVGESIHVIGNIWFVILESSKALDALVFAGNVSSRVGLVDEVPHSNPIGDKHKGVLNGQ